MLFKDLFELRRRSVAGLKGEQRERPGQTEGAERSRVGGGRSRLHQDLCLFMAWGKHDYTS